jgi:hypothetical protein
LASCSDAPPDTGTVVVGVTSELRAGVDIATLDTVMRVNGSVVKQDSLWGTALAFPMELRFGDLKNDDSVEAALTAVSPLGEPLLTRSARSRVMAGRTVILPVRLDAKCAGIQAPQCPSPLTCIAGVCGPSFVDPRFLKDYSPAWTGGSGDICKPVNAGAPVVIVGEGLADYLPTADLDVAQVEAGPQGGHHVWVAIRMKNLRRSGSITTITGFVPDLAFDISPFSVIFTFDQDEGGYCKLYGLRFQIDTEKDIQELLGKTLRVTVKVTDSEGAEGIGERLVTLSDTIL